MVREVEDMLRVGAIHPLLRSWATLVILVAKPDGSIRFSADYRKLSSFIKSDAYPKPRIGTLLGMLGSVSVMSTVDLCMGHWQLELEPEARDKSAFLTSDGPYEYIVLSFGLRNAPAIFQRLVCSLLTDMAKFEVAYIDNRAILSRTWICT